MKKSDAPTIRMRIIFWLTGLLPDCQSITPLIGRTLDGELSLVGRIKVRVHLLICEACRNYLNNLKFMREVYRSGEESAGRPDAEDIGTAAKLGGEARARIKKALEDRL